MSSLGARSQTLEEIYSTFVGGFPEEQIHEQFQQIKKVILKIDKIGQVSIAKELYAKKGFKIMSSFLELSQTFSETWLGTSNCWLQVD